MTTYRLTITDDQGTVLDSTEVTAEEWKQALNYSDAARDLLYELNVPADPPPADVVVHFAWSQTGEFQPWWKYDGQTFPTPDDAWNAIRTDYAECGIADNITGLRDYTDQEGDTWRVLPAPKD